MTVILPDVVSIWISFASKLDWTVKREKLLEERGAGHPHPRAGIHRPIGVKHQLFKDLNFKDNISVPSKPVVLNLLGSVDP